jgi:glycopeptide antibiotics resistance protein
MPKKLLLILLLVCTAAVFYYSWLPDPKLASETYLPAWLLNWSNLHFNLRTAIPFVGIGFFLEMWGTTPDPKKKTKAKVIRSLFHTVLAAIIVSVAEVGQYFILNRHPDSMDILFGVLGSVFGVFVYHIGVLLRKTKTV